MMKFHYFQACMSDANVGNPRKRFDELEAELATIGAKIHWPIMMTHDDCRLEVDCPVGCEAEAQAILDKHFPSEI